MKKLLLITFMAAFSVALTAQEFVEIWSHYGDNAPEWFTDGTEADIYDPSFSASERGIVYNPVDGYLYVASRHGEDSYGDEALDRGEPHVYVLDPETGEAPAFGLSKLLTTGITSADQNYGGGYPLNNVTVDESGRIFACNMTLASGADIVGSDGVITYKAFRVYHWSWQQDIPQMVVDYKDGGYRLGDKFSVIGNWETQAYIYAGAGGTSKMLRWSVTAGVVSETPDIISLKDIEGAGTSPTVAPVPDKDDWMYVSGKGFLPTLFTTDGTNLSQIAITAANLPSSVIAGRTIEFGGRTLMAMFSGDQSAFILDLSKHGENVTDADIIGWTPTFGTKYDNAYGEGAVEFGIIDDELYVYICAPSNGVACYRIDGLIGINSKEVTNEYNVSAYPNPAIDFTNIQYTLPDNATGALSVKLFDITGKFMSITVDRAHGGQQEMKINTSELTTGTYLYQVVYNNKISKGKLLVK